VIAIEVNGDVVDAMSALPPKADIRCKNKNSRLFFRRHRQICTFIGKLPAGQIQHV